MIRNTTGFRKQAGGSCRLANPLFWQQMNRAIAFPDESFSEFP
jgi:hypothetical protein